MFQELIRELAVISILAAIGEVLLPNHDGNRPLYFIFGLYFIALLLNPLVKLWTNTDFTTMDFSALAEERVIEIEESTALSQVYDDTAETLSSEIETKLRSLFPGNDYAVQLKMNENGFEQVIINCNGRIPEDSETAKIRELLAAEFGIGEEFIDFKNKG